MTMPVSDNTAVETGIAIERATNAQNEAETAVETAQEATATSESAMQIASNADDVAYATRNEVESLHERISVLTTTVEQLISKGSEPTSDETEPAPPKVGKESKEPEPETPEPKVRSTPKYGSAMWFGDY